MDPTDIAIAFLMAGIALVTLGGIWNTLNRIEKLLRRNA